MEKQTLLSLYDKYSELFEKITETENPEEAQNAIIEYIKTGQDLQYKISNTVGFISSLDKEIEKMKELKKKIETKIKRLEQYELMLKQRIIDVMKATGIKKIQDKDKLYSITLVEGKEDKVEITDEKLLPLDCIEIIEVIKPNKEKIKEKLKNGEIVEGARLIKTDDYVVIR